MKTEATKRPWKVFMGNTTFADGGERKITSWNIISRDDCFVVAENMTEQDADLIVRAVNSHDALVEALERLDAETSKKHKRVKEIVNDNASYEDKALLLNYHSGMLDAFELVQDIFEQATAALEAARGE